MTTHIDAPPHVAVDEPPMAHGTLSAVVATMISHPGLNFDGEERRGGDDRRSGADRRGDKDRRGGDRVHSLPRRMRGNRRRQQGIGGRRATD